MNIAVFGTGNVGQTIGDKLIELGHVVMMGSQSDDNPKGLEFVKRHSNDNARLGHYYKAAKFADLIFNCTAGVGSINALMMAGKENLKGKVLIDLANPLDFSNGMPPSLFVVNTTSLGEQIQETFPDLRVVKSLNTMWCGIMVNPGIVNGGNHNVFMCGNDNAAKNKTRQILQSFGWKTENIIDLGDITKARGTEMYLPLWLSLYGNMQSASFNIQIVK